MVVVVVVGVRVWTYQSQGSASCLGKNQVLSVDIALHRKVTDYPVGSESVFFHPAGFNQEVELKATLHNISPNKYLTICLRPDFNFTSHDDQSSGSQLVGHRTVFSRSLVFPRKYFFWHKSSEKV